MVKVFLTVIRGEINVGATETTKEVTETTKEVMETIEEVITIEEGIAKEVITGIAEEGLEVAEEVIRAGKFL